MKIELSDIDIDLTNCKIDLPKYMKTLSSSEVCNDNNLSEIIVSAGADPIDGKILLITADLKIKIFDARKYFIPDGPAEPAEGGKKVYLKNTNNRWPTPTEGFFVDSKWLLKCSESAMKNMTLETNT